MIYTILVTALILSTTIPMIIFFKSDKTKRSFRRSILLNICAFFGVFLFATLFIFNDAIYAAGEATIPAVDNGMRYLAAAIAVGLGSIGAGIATGQAASAALGALSENETIFGKALIFVALAEGVAIYGLIIAILILMG